MQALIVPIGIFLGFCANVIVKDTGRIAWRLQLGSAFIPSFILAIGIFFCPESPRWLMKHGKIAQGFKSMSRLRAHPIIAARDYYYSYVIYEEEVKMAAGSNYFTRLRDCFTIPRIRRANYGASTVMLAQQMCGINSKLPLISFCQPFLISCSYLFLQLDHLLERWLHGYPGFVCITWIWCYSSSLHHTYAISDRH